MKAKNMTESKLSAKLKNVPTDTSLVCSSTNDGLNRVERLSDRRIVLTDNLGKENLLWQEGQDLRVPAHMHFIQKKITYNVNSSPT